MYCVMVRLSSVDVNSVSLDEAMYVDSTWIPHSSERPAWVHLPTSGPGQRFRSH
jgi:hypothetical protein